MNRHEKVGRSNTNTTWPFWQQNPFDSWFHFKAWHWLQIIFISLRLYLLFSISFSSTIFSLKSSIQQHAIFKRWSLLCSCWIAYIFLFWFRILVLCSSISVSLEFLFLCVEFVIVFEFDLFVSVSNSITLLFLILFWFWMFTFCSLISDSFDFFFLLFWFWIFVICSFVINFFFFL